MRVASSLFYSNAVADIGRQQSELARVQQQISSGRRIARPSDDPIGAARTLELNQGLGELKQFGENASVADRRLGLEDATLASVTSLLQQVRDVALQSNSDVHSQGTRGALKAEVEQRLQELVQYANTRDANGEHLFSGYQGNTQPFSLSASGATYNGDQGQREIRIGPSRQIQVSDSGDEVFMRIRNGNGRFSVDGAPGNTGSGLISAGVVTDPLAYQSRELSIRFTSDTSYDVIDVTNGAVLLAGEPYESGAAISAGGIEVSVTGEPLAGDEFTIEPSGHKDVFETLQDLVDVLSTDALSTAEEAQRQQSINGVIGNLDQALDHILAVRTTVGARQNTIESVRAVHSTVELQLSETLSDVRDVDYTEAISRLQFHMTALQAAQGSFAQLQDLSLFNFLR